MVARAPGRGGADIAAAGELAVRRVASSAEGHGWGPGNARDGTRPGPRRASVAAARHGTTHMASSAMLECGLRSHRGKALLDGVRTTGLVLPSKRRKKSAVSCWLQPEPMSLPHQTATPPADLERPASEPANDDSIPARRHIWPTCQRLTSARFRTGQGQHARGPQL
jgi:hypothetical protein